MQEKRYSLEETAYAILEEKILSGAIPAGECITEQHACDLTGASRTPVREAIRHLERDGLIRIEPNRTAVVVGIGRTDLADIYEIRRRSEGLASRRAAGKAGETDCARLFEIVEMQEFFLEKGGTEKLKDLDGEFHDLVYRICDSRIISEALVRLHRQIALYRKRSRFAPGRAAESVREHRAIAEAIRKGDGDAAEELTVRHVEAAYLNLMKVLEKNYGNDLD